MHQADKEVKATEGKKWFPFDFDTLTLLRKIPAFESKLVEHLKTRCFRFIHHYCGTREFGLDEALQEEATSLGLRLEIPVHDRWIDGDGWICWQHKL